jgi:LacI family transcriptional regulator
MVESRVTIRNIAEKANVHFTTVSLALRNSPRLKAETREKIQKIARAMGYAPDPMLSALNAYRQAHQPVHYQASIAWIHNWPDPKHLYDCEEFNQYYRGACARAKDRGYTITSFWLQEPGMSIHRLHGVLRARNIRGALLAPQPEANQFLDLNYKELSAVAFGYSMQPAVLDLITNHHVHTMNLLLKKTYELGYRRFGLCVPKDWDEKVDHAWQSCLLLLYELNPELPRIPIFWSNWSASGNQNLVKWMRKHRPDVIISSNDMPDQLRAAGFRIPEDVGFASPFLGWEETTLSGIHQNDRLIGSKAVDMVIDMLHRGETGLPETPVRVLVEGVWCPGTTLRDVSGKIRRQARKPGTPVRGGRAASKV